MIRPKSFLFVSACIALALAAGWLLLAQRSPASCPGCNIILVSIDTLRPDHLGCYGYARPTSPNIDEFRKDAVLFSSAIAQAPSTTPSHASMLTSLLPSLHGAFFSRRSPISPNIPTLAELLKAQGYATASFNGGGQVAAEFGFDRGFDVYQSYSGSDYQNEDFIDRVREAVAWLKEQSPEKFFIFLHTYEVHSPFAPADEYLDIFRRPDESSLPRMIDSGLLDQINRKKISLSEADRLRIIDSYDGEIRSMDAGWRVLIDFLKESRLYERTMIIFTSDHGEEFGEHGKIGHHSHTLYDELLKVPLLIRFPFQRWAGASITAQVRSIDIMPTVLDMVNAPKQEHFQGESLLGLSRGRAFDPFAFSQRDSKRPQPPTSIRTARWKLYKGKLFDLSKDPAEQTNVSAQNPQVARDLQDRINQVLGLETPSAGAFKADADTLNQLRTLGYIE